MSSEWKAGKTTALWLVKYDRALLQTEVKKLREHIEKLEAKNG